MPRRKTFIKIAVALGLLVGLGFVFVSSVRDTRAAPYAVDRASLSGWTVGLQEASGPTAPALVLRVAPELASGVFRQVFTRAMESLSSPAVPAIPLLLQGELEGAAADVTPEALLAAAQGAGLDGAAFKPRCLGHRRVSQPGMTSQLYFVLFDAPAFTRFRQQMGARLGARFDPGALSPVLLVGASEPSFSRWLPLRADPNADCVAPIVTR